MAQFILDGGIIQPRKSLFSALVIMVRRKRNSWRTCLDYRALNKITIKDKFPILVIDELLDEIHGVAYFTKLDIKLRYDQIKLRKYKILKLYFKTHEENYEF